MRRAIRKVTRAFTLLEMLLAIAITGLLLGAASYLLVSLSTIWTLRTDDAAFDEHADGVANFLQQAFDETYGHYQPEWKKTTGSSDTSKGDSSTTQTDDTKTTEDTERTTATGTTVVSTKWNNSGVTLSLIDSNTLIDKPLLHFKFFQFPPALGETNPPTALGVEAWLRFDSSKGLFIVWKDIWSIQENVVTDDKDLLYSSLISSFVTRIDYIYWMTDRKLWLEYGEPQEESGSYMVPDFIRLTFSEKGRNVTRLIRIPNKNKTMPLF